MKKYIAILMAISMLALASCSTSDGTDVSSNISTSQTNTDTSDNSEDSLTTETTATIDSLTFPSDDYTKDLSEGITFSDGDEILITESGTYEFTGEYTNSTITVNVNKDTDEGIVYLVLNNASITSETGTPINIIEAKDVVIVLEGENAITQGEITTSDAEFPSAAIYSKADTVITGDGSLTVTTLYQDGINSRDDLVIDGATITVNAAEDGIVGKDFLAINDTVITVTAGKDGLKSSNAEDLEKGNLLIVSGNFNITAENDAISSENILQVDGGDFELYSGGGYVEVIKTPSSGPMGGGADGDMGGGRGDFGSNQQPPSMNGEDFDPTIEAEATQSDDTFEESMKTLKAVNSITINGGTFNISAYEDAVHSDGDININDGDFTINAGDDGFTSINTTITNGTINIENCFEGIEGNTVNISGGDISITTNDDGINASDKSGGITISGGNIEIFYGEGGDGIDSNGAYTQTGGDIVITATSHSDAMNAPLDVDGTVTMTGGTIVDENGEAVEATTRSDMGGTMPGGGGERPEGFTPDGFGSSSE